MPSRVVVMPRFDRSKMVTPISASTSFTATDRLLCDVYRLCAAWLMEPHAAISMRYLSC